MFSASRRRSALISAVLVLLLLTVAPRSAVAAPTTQSGATHVTSAATNACGPIASFAASNFPSRPKIDNTWLPLVPGANSVLRGTVEGDDGRLHKHSIVSTVTDLTKTINGVRTLIVFERDYDDGKLQEAELAFEAQDLAGRVWNMGEYPEEYENGSLTGAPSTWIAGLAHATAGIGMLADPQPGTRSYLQGRAPAVDFYDCAKVAETGQHTCVPVGCFDNVLVIDEWAPFDPEGGHQLKHYASGVGTIRVGAAGGVNAEVLELVKTGKLGGQALAKIRAQVIAQDSRGYQLSDVYAQTPPVQPLDP